MGRNAAVTAHAPAQHDILTDRGRRQVYCCSDEATGVPRPRQTGSERVATADANHPIVATGNKDAARSNDVRKCAAANADLQHATIKAVLQVVIVAEGQLRRSGDDGNDWRIEQLVANDRRIVNERGIRR